MNKFLILLIGLVFISCLKEPKKDNFSSDKQLIVEPIPSVIKNSNTDNVEYIINKEQQDSKQVINSISKQDIVETLNNLTKSSGFQTIKYNLSFLNQRKGLMLLDSYEFNIENVYAVFLNKDYNDGFGEYRVSIECEKRSSGSNCLYNTVNPDYISASIFPLTSKEACIEYVELFNKLNQ